jgi:omega-6 fatty acid desaturase (delta-12 desaturase)
LTTPAASPASPEPDALALAPVDRTARVVRRIAEHCRRFQDPDWRRSLGQAALSLSLYAALVAAALASAASGLWPVALLLAPPLAGMLVKLFVIQHDCGHGSYFRSRRANDEFGRFLSLLTFTPYEFWRDAHNRHHSSSGDLSRRGVGAVDTLTVDEYLRLSPARRALYRLYRHPLTMIFVGAPVYFLVQQRLPVAGRPPFAEIYHGLGVDKVWKSVVGLDIALLGFYGAFMWAFGVGAVLLALLPALILASWAGAWLFFVQHQYEDAYWADRAEWNYAEAALYGSSHYDLPKFLHWITGNIGLHHIHHLAARIPNYRLFECLKASEELRRLPRLSVVGSLKCARLALWDEDLRKMISFRALKRRAEA